jgi:hypothetical protein
LGLSQAREAHVAFAAAVDTLQEIVAKAGASVLSPRPEARKVVS